MFLQYSSTVIIEGRYDMKCTLAVLVVLNLLFLAWPLSGEESLVPVAHVSFLEGNLAITNRDGNTHGAVVNFPVVAGDILRTDGDGRAEIQFGNGTLMRIDKDSELLVSTILAPLLTYERWKVTTLKLNRGAVYVISNIYNQEMLQVVSEDVAVNFLRNTNVEIRLEPEKGTQVISHFGKADLLVAGEDGKDKSGVIKGKNAATVSKTGEIKAFEYQKGGDFWLWNEGVNEHFKELHEGKSYVPDKILRHAHLQLWAERWSSSFGEWVYDKMFGYIWKPAGDFAHDRTRRPFYNGKTATVNGVVYVIPDSPWGWAPAHLGTWVFIKKWGWTWIPGQGSGDVFTPTVHTLMDWIWRTWGSCNGFYAYLDGGIRGWQNYYKRYYFAEYGNMVDYSAFFKNLKLHPDEAPSFIRLLIHKMQLMHPHRVKALLAEQSDEFIDKKQYKMVKIEKEKLVRPDLHSAVVVPVRGVDAPKALISPVSKGDIGVVSKQSGVGQAVRLRHDWNPDRWWAVQNRVEILYSSQSNSIIVPKMQFDSAKLTRGQRSEIHRTFNSDSSSARGFSGSYSDGSSVSASGTGSASGGSTTKEKK